MENEDRLKQILTALQAGTGDAETQKTAMRLIRAALPIMSTLTIMADVFGMDGDAGAAFIALLSGEIGPQSQGTRRQPMGFSPDPQGMLQDPMFDPRVKGSRRDN